ncbi:MAG: DUF2868 domain-containing protein [Planctomycetota bacterium]
MPDRHNHYVLKTLPPFSYTVFRHFAARPHTDDDASMTPARREPVPVSALDVVELGWALQQDDAKPRTAVLERDRLAAQQLPADLPPESHTARLLAWLRITRDPDRAQLRRRTAAGLSAVTAGLVLIGLALGYTSALAVFAYDGNQPVNVVRALLVYGLANLVLLALTILFVLPHQSSPRHQNNTEPKENFLTGLRDALLWISPGRLGTLLLRVLPGDLKHTAQHLQTHHRVYGHAQALQIITWSQTLGTAFHAAALAGFLQLVLFTDLAFGWATTLGVGPESFHSLTAWIAIPWSWLGFGNPSWSLVQNSRFFRGQPFEADGLQAWWPFVLMVMLTYGILPRIAARIVAGRFLNRAFAAALRWTPGAGEVLARLAAASASGQAPTPEAPPTPTPTATLPASTPPPQASPLKPQPSTHSIGWAGLPADHAAGGTQSLDQDRATIQALADTVANADTPPIITLRVKAYEPPVLEILDFLTDLREALGDAIPIHTELVGQPHPTATQTQVWQQRLATLNDPWLRVTPGSSPAEPTDA